MKCYRGFLTSLLLVMSFHITFSQPNNPRANPPAVVTSSEVRFSILTSQLVRMEWNRTNTFEDRASLVVINRCLPVPAYKVSDEGEWLVITTDKLVLRYRKGSGRFIADNLSISFKLNEQRVSWHPGLEDTLNLEGTTRTLDGTNGEKDVTLEQGLVSRGGWSLIDDSGTLLFDGSEWDWVTQRPTDERQDWYFFGYGHDYRKALFDFTQVAGKIPMPPRFAFGYWWSRYWTYSDDELRHLIADMRRYDVPIDVLIIDMDWHQTYGLSVHGTKRDPFGQAVGWTGFTWNRDLFPDPERFLRWTKEGNLKIALNLHPASGIAPMEASYAEFARAYGFDTSRHEYVPFALEDKKWAETYFDVIVRPLEKQGIDFWWLDWQAWLENKTIKGLSNTWWLNYTFFIDMERRGEKRPLLFHRWGGLGNHRYQIGFSGDSWSTWEALSYQPYFTATAANVGYGYWSHDIGGHVGNDPDPELYLRWIQFGIFSPILRTHSTKSSAIERRIWKYSEHFETMREAFQLRYAFVPYIYTAARKAYESGISICRPMYYDYPDTWEAYDFKGQYMFGDDMLVAPVTQKASLESGLSTRKVWLPKGKWYEWFTGTLLKGDTVVERKFALNEIPLYVKAGTIIPMYPTVSNLQRQIDTLVLMVIPGASGGTQVYEDDGSSSGYQRGEYTFTRVTKEDLADGVVKVTVFPRAGYFKEMSKVRAYELRLPCTFPPEGVVVVNGKRYVYSPEARVGTWTYRGADLTTHIFTPAFVCSDTVEVLIRYSDQVKGKQKLLDGKIGLLGRLPRIVQLMKDEVNRHDQIANAPTLVLKAASLSTRIEYQPEKTLEYLQEYESSFSDMLREVMYYPRGDERVLDAIVNQLPSAFRILSKPIIKLDAAVSEEPTKVELLVSDSDAVIRYTLDGSSPNEQSPLYVGPFYLRHSAALKARALRAGCLASFPATATFQLLFAKRVTYEFPCSERFCGGGPDALIDGRFGTAMDHRKDWVGFEGHDMIATIELLKPQTISTITTRFLRDQNGWIFLPTHISYEVSSDGVHYQNVFEKDTKNEAYAKSNEPEIVSSSAAIGGGNVSFIRIKAKNIGVCPDWHMGAGGKAWLFTDEVVVE